MPLLESIRYPSNFITNVTLRLEGSAPPADKKHAAALHERIARLFPLIVERATGPAGPGGWVFADDAQQRTAVLTAQGISLSCGRYIDWDGFSAVAVPFHEAACAVFGPAVAGQMSLRFINTITLQGDPFDWKGLVHPALTTVLDRFVWEKQEVARSMGQLVFHKGDHLIYLNYGIPNPAFPARITRREFLIDIECAGDGAPVEHMPRRLKDFHDEIQSLFEGCIEEGLRAVLWGEK